MEDDLKMKGSMPLNIAIFAFGCLVFAGTMYGLTRSDSEDKKVQQLEQASKQAKAAEETKEQGEFAKMEAGGPAGETPVTSAPEGAAPPEPAASGGGTPPPAPSASNDAATPAPVPATQEVAKSDDEVNSKPKQKQKPKPSVMGVLTPWWEPTQTSPFNVQFVGRSVDEKKIVVVFNQGVDAAANADKIKVVDAKGKRVTTSWQAGENPNVLVNGDLKPGRYLVMIDPTVAGTNGQPVGVPVHGPVVLQPDSQTS